jgi:hypothetical protein
MAVNLPIITEFDGKGINKAIAEFKKLETSSEKAAFVMKKAFVPAVAVIGGLATALGMATKAAMEDDAAQQQLALTLRNVTNASKEQVAAVEAQISSMTLATGIADDQLRPAFEALTRGTKDISVSMRDMSLVTDIATATNKPLVDVADALAKAYQGNFRGLQQLSPEMKTLIKDGADMDTIMHVLTGTFGGATETFAKTAQGGFARLSVAINETKEAIGAALLPVVERVLPILNRFAAWASNNPKAFLAIAGAIGAVAAAIVAVNIAMALNPFTAIAAGVALLVSGLVIAYNKFEWFRKGVNTLLNGYLAAFEMFANSMISAINLIITGLNYINPLGDIPQIPSVSLPRLGMGGGTPFANLTTENRGGYTGNVASMFPAPAFAGGAGGGAGGGGAGGGGGGGGAAAIAAPSFASPAIQSVLPDYFMADPTTQAAMNITINVDGGLATSADIGESVVNALRQYNQVQGPIPVAVA